MENLSKLVDELSELAKEKKRIGERYSEVEAKILKYGEAELKDSKEKSIVYKGTGISKVTFTKSESLKQVYPSFFKEIFGVVYKDLVKEETTYTLNAQGKKLLIDMWLGNYMTDSSMESIIKSLEVDEKTEKVLLKKLKGKNPEVDKKTLMTVANLDEKTASETAYFILEVKAWDNFMALINANNSVKKEDEEPVNISNILDKINSAVMVDEGVKVSVE